RMEEAHALALAHDEPDTPLVEGVQLGGREALLGRYPDDAEITRRDSSAPAYEELSVIVRALALIQAGDAERARSLVLGIDLDEMEGRWIASYGWLWILAHLAEAAAELDEVDLMTKVEERLRPHAGTCVVVAGGVSFLGSVSHYLGRLYAGLNRPADATAAYQEALAAYDRLRADPWADRTRRAMSALESSGEGDAIAELTREGPFWALRYDGRTCRVKDAKGVRDLAVLVASPNREVPAAELMAQGMAADAVGTGADAVLDERARRESRERLTDLDADLADAEAANDLGRIGRIKDE